jgi:hypothetical protein
MKSKKSAHSHQRIYTLLILVIFLVAAGTLIYCFTKSNSPTTVTVKQSGATKPINSNPTTTSNSSVSTLPYQAPVINPDTNVPGGVTPNTSTVSLAAPEGMFVSNHGNGNNPAVTVNTQEESTCSTTPGASCQIIFTDGSQTESLVVKQTSTENSKTGIAAGTVSWSWTPAQIGLTPGDWKIAATATLNGQTSSTQDAADLVISQ